MTPERMRQIEDIFHAACELPPAGRQAYLAQVCGSDHELRREVELLLASDGEVGSLYEAPAYERAAPLISREQTQITPGMSISHYEILSRLGAGGMGEVWRARDKHLKRDVAIKLLPSEFAQDADRLRRFEREAQAASALNHPNILTIYEIGSFENTRFIVTELIEGQTLRRQIASGPMNLLEVLKIAVQIAGALAVAHDAGIIHRDIKPENIMVRSDGLVKVLDFGLAKLRPLQPTEGIEFEDTTKKVLTGSGVVMGTVGYMSPEQVRGQILDHRSDLFSFGILLYEIISGHRPFEGDSFSEVTAAIMRDNPPRLSSQFSHCPESVEGIVNRCLAKAPSERYQSANELHSDLQAVHIEFDNKLRPSKTGPGESRKIGRLINDRSRLVAMTAGMAFITLVGILLYSKFWIDTAENQVEQIAVLPLRPLQSSNTDEAFESGVTSMLITSISGLRRLVDRPESSVSKYGQLNQDPLVAGREQKVDAVFDSRYQRSGDKIRFNLRLIRVADGVTLWADTVDQQSGDIFAIQDTLADKVVEGLRLRLSSAEKNMMAKRYTDSTDAWILYARGRELLHSRVALDNHKAIDCFLKAIAIDPNFALAYTMLGKSYLSLAYIELALARDVQKKAKTAIDKALKLDDNLAEAHAHFADYILQFDGDQTRASQEYSRALALNPNSSDVSHAYAFFLLWAGRTEQAISEIRRAESLDPTNRWITHNVAQVLYFARRYNEAIERSHQLADIFPDWGAVYVWRYHSYVSMKNEQAAFETRLKQREANGAGPDELALMKMAFDKEGMKGYWKLELDQLLKQQKTKHLKNTRIAELYARLGEKEQALVWLEKAVEGRDFYIVAINVDPDWDILRADPRFVSLVKRVGILQ